MANSFKKDTILAFIWNAIDKVGAQFILLIVGVITARILSPKDFGLIGVLAIFSILSNILVESGFPAAIMRRKEVSNEEYTAVLYFNVIFSIFLYLILFFSAPYIANYFEMPELKNLSRFLFLTIIFNSLGIVQTTRSSLKLEFKFLSLTNIISIAIAGVISIWMAIVGYAYWAIAFQQVLMVIFRIVILWIWGDFKLTSRVDFSIIKKLFKFSSNLLVTSVINIVATNIYNIIIGKIYSIQTLGYYSQAQKYQMIPSTIINNTLQGVAYPVLNRLNDDKQKQVYFFRKLIRVAAFLIFPLMMGLYACADELVTIVLTEKWLPAVAYFRILIVASLVFPFRVLSLNLLIANGKPKHYMYLELFKNGLIFAFIFLSYNNIEYLLIGYATANFIAFLVNSHFASKVVEYKMCDMFKDLLPYFALSLLITAYIYLIKLLMLNIYLQLSVEIIGAVVIYIGLLKILKSKVLEDLTQILKGNI